MVGFGCYLLEKKYNQPLHPVWPLKLGFTSEVGKAADCADPADLINLIMASSCTPPFVPVIYRTGKPALDGGLIDNVPLAALTEDDLPALIMLSRVTIRPSWSAIRAGPTFSHPNPRRWPSGTTPAPNG